MPRDGGEEKGHEKTRYVPLTGLLRVKSTHWSGQSCISEWQPVCMAQLGLRPDREWVTETQALPLEHGLLTKGTLVTVRMVYSLHPTRLSKSYES